MISGISQEWNKNETDHNAFLWSIKWQYNEITCSMFGNKFQVKTFLDIAVSVAEIPVQCV